MSTTSTIATLALLFSLLLASCGDDAPPADDPDSSIDSAVDDSSPPDGALVPPDATNSTGTVRLVTGPHNVMPGQERTLCVTLDLGNESPAMIREVRTTLSPGSHHMIVQRVDRGSAQPTPTPCGGFSHEGHVIFLSQQAEASIAYPDGAGLPIRAHQLIGIEIHFINYISDETVDVMGLVEFDLVPADAGLEEVEVLFTGELSLHLPPRERTTVQNDFPIPTGRRVFALTSHTHQLGVEATLERVSATGETTPLHRSTTWSEPPLDIFDPPLEFASGEQIRLTCVYENSTDEAVSFGVGFNDEMCFFWAYFY